MISKNLSRFFRNVEQIITKSSDPVDTLKNIIAVYFDVFSFKKTYTKLVLDAIASEPQELEQILKNVKFNLKLDIPGKFLHFLEEGMENRIFRYVDPKQLLLNIVSMTMFYFFGKPTIKALCSPVAYREKLLLIVKCFLHGRE